MYTKIQLKKDEKKRNAETVICGSILCYFLFYFVYLFFSVQFIIGDRELVKQCEKSNIIQYLISTLVIQFVTSVIEYFSVDLYILRDQELTPTTKSWFQFTVLRTLGYIIMATWGYYELFMWSCPSLIKSNIWTITYIAYILTIILGIAFNVFLCIHGIAKIHLEKKQKKQHRGSSQSQQQQENERESKGFYGSIEQEEQEKDQMEENVEYFNDLEDKITV